MAEKDLYHRTWKVVKLLCGFLSTCETSLLSICGISLKILTVLKSFLLSEFCIVTANKGGTEKCKSTKVKIWRNKIEVKSFGFKVVSVN